MNKRIEKLKDLFRRKRDDGLLDEKDPKPLGEIISDALEYITILLLG